MPRTKKRYNNMFLAVAAMFASMVSVSNVAAAQGGINVADLFNELAAKRIAEGMSEVLRHRMIVTPEEAIVSKETGSVVVSFSNPTKDTMTAEIVVYTTPPPPVKAIEASSQEDNRPIPSFLADSDPRKRSSKEKSPSTYKPLSKAWITNLPDSISLAPGETKELTINIDVPDDLIEGFYVAWIAAAVELTNKDAAADKSKDSSKAVQVKVKGLPEDQRRAVMSSSKIMYNIRMNKATSE